MKKIASLFLTIALIFATALPASATSINPVEVADATYLPSGSYIYHIDNKTYFYDIIEKETVLLAEKNYPTIAFFAVNHVPETYPYWNWFRTDGPYSTTVNMAAVHRIIQQGGSYLDASIEMGLTVAVIQYMIEAANGNITSFETIWEIDDGYTYYNDVTYFRIEAYYYAESTCETLIDRYSHTYHG